MSLHVTYFDHRIKLLNLKFLRILFKHFAINKRDVYVEKTWRVKVHITKILYLAVAKWPH